MLLGFNGWPWTRRRAVGWAVAASAAAGGVVLAYALLSDGSDDAIHEAVSAGRPIPAPALELEVLTAGDLGGVPRRWWRVARDGRVSLRELRGIPLVISFWTAGCRPCREESAALQRAATETGHRVLVLGVGTAQPAPRARGFVQDLRLSFPQLHDGSGETARRWGVDAVPETFFLAPDGDIVGHVVGRATGDDLKSGVAAAAADRPAGLRTGGEQAATG